MHVVATKRFLRSAIVVCRDGIFRSCFGPGSALSLSKCFGPTCKIFSLRRTLLSPGTVEAIALVKPSIKNEDHLVMYNLRHHQSTNTTQLRIS